MLFCIFLCLKADRVVGPEVEVEVEEAASVLEEGEEVMEEMVERESQLLAVFVGNKVS